VTVEEQAVKVTEKLLIANRTEATYVGEPNADRPGTTLRVSIPENFERVTFDKEFYGRRFLVVDRRPVTDIPWPPGEREIQFTYWLPLDQTDGCFRRTLDVPCSNLRVRLRGERADRSTCNLPRRSQIGDDVAFESSGQVLPANFEIELNLATSQFAWRTFARWGSLILLGALVSATVIAYRNHGPRNYPAPS
jgi:hypothetical protein